jgi:hypothetical protein
MPSQIICESGHKSRRYREVAIEINEHGSLSPCKRCGRTRHYYINQFYPHLNETHKYELDRVIRVYPPEEAKRGFDPMFFLLYHRLSGESAVWSFYWIRDRHGKWKAGQFPPILALATFKEAVKTLEVYKTKEPYPLYLETPHKNQKFKIDWMLGKKTPC